MFSPTLDLAAPEIAAFLGRKEELNTLISRLRDALRLRETETEVPEGYYKFTSGFVKLLMGLYEGQTKKLREQERLNLRMRNGGSEEFSVYNEVYEKQTKFVNETVEKLNNQLTRHIVGMEELMKLKKDLALVKQALTGTKNQLANLSRFVGSSARSVIDQVERIDEISDYLTDTLHGLNRQYPGLDKSLENTYPSLDYEDEIHNMADLYAEEVKQRVRRHSDYSSEISEAMDEFEQIPISRRRASLDLNFPWKYITRSSDQKETGPFYFFVLSHFGLNWCMAGCAWVETKTHFQSKYFTT